jgi:hypothetical protein
MPSPFPGMNPYLEHEDAWHNFHVMFPTAVIAQLNPRVGPDYYLKADEHVYIHELPEGERKVLGRPDVFVGGNPSGKAGPQPATGVAIAAQPQELRLPAVDVERVPFVEIRDRRDRRLVTVIELLSPSNKRATGDRLLYEAKRAAVLSSPVHLVEIDLLRGGKRLSPAESGSGDYGILISRAKDRPSVQWYPVRLRERLPEIPVPLEGSSAFVPLDLQAVIHRLYDDGGYERFMYESEPQPPLLPEDAVWAESLIPTGLRR